jgi:hypothetical protein
VLQARANEVVDENAAEGALKKRAGRNTRLAARLTLASASAFLLLLLALHGLERELQPSWHFISEYELGPFGWVMRLAFFCLSVSCASLCVALFSEVRWVGRLGLGLVLLTAIAFAFGGLFLTDPPGLAAAAQTSHGRLHNLGATLDALPLGALLVNASLWRNPSWRRARRTLGWTALLPLLGVVVFVASVALLLPRHGGQFGPEVWVGWTNRLLILAHCAWLMPVAWHASKLDSVEPSQPG